MRLGLYDRVAVTLSCFFSSVLSLSDLLSDVIYAHIQVERKRHIGNDIVTIVFQEGEEPCPAFKPSMIRSHFTRILGLVTALVRWAITPPQGTEMALSPRVIIDLHVIIVLC